MQKLRWGSATKNLLSRLAVTPARCGLARMVGGTKVSDYSDLVQRRPSQIILNGYICALFEAVTTLLFTIPNTESVELAFENTDRYREMAGMVLALIKGF